MELSLRKAASDDMDLLFEWANDADVRRNAFNTDAIPYDEHKKWFCGALADKDILQYIMCDGGQPVGQIRLNIEGKSAYIDYSIARSMRGKGLGSSILKLMEHEVIDNAPNIAELVGQVKYGNEPSAHAFEKCGYIRADRDNFIEYKLDIRR